MRTTEAPSSNTSLADTNGNSRPHDLHGALSSHARFSADDLPTFLVPPSLFLRPPLRETTCLRPETWDTRRCQTLYGLGGQDEATDSVRIEMHA